MYKATGTQAYTRYLRLVLDRALKIFSKVVVQTPACCEVVVPSKESV